MNKLKQLIIMDGNSMAFCISPQLRNIQRNINGNNEGEKYKFNPIEVRVKESLKKLQIRKNNNNRPRKIIQSKLSESCLWKS